MACRRGRPEIGKTDATDGGAGNRLHPGPGPIGPGPGPWAVLGSTVAAASGIIALRISILPSNALRGMRGWGESCARAATPNVTAIAEAMMPREIRRVLVALKVNGMILFFK